MWDIRDVCCIQTIPSRLLTPGPVVISSIYFNPKNNTLLMGTNALFAFEKKGRTKLKLLIFRKHGLEIMFSGLSSFRKRGEETI